MVGTALLRNALTTDAGGLPSVPRGIEEGVHSVMLSAEVPGWSGRNEDASGVASNDCKLWDSVNGLVWRIWFAGAGCFVLRSDGFFPVLSLTWSSAGRLYCASCEEGFDKFYRAGDRIRCGADR